MRASADDQIDAVVGGVEYPATVVMRSGNADVDVAVLAAPDLLAVGPLTCAVVNREMPNEVRDCCALGFAVWKDRTGGQLLAGRRPARRCCPAVPGRAADARSAGVAAGSHRPMTTWAWR